MNKLLYAIKTFGITRNPKTGTCSPLERALAAGLFFIIACGANASPCDGVDRNLSQKRRLALKHKLANEFRSPSEDIRQSFRYQGWTILHEYSRVADDSFLFYSQDPMTSDSVTAWGGAGPETVEEELDTKKWVLENVPGIPPKLASCFAWYVTFGRASDTNDAGSPMNMQNSAPSTKVPIR